MNYSDLQLTIKDNTVCLDEHPEITVLQYLPIADKNSIIELALQNSEQGTIYNEFKLKMYFELYITYMYSNIEFSEEDKADEAALYDALYSNGVIRAILCALPQEEFNELYHAFEHTKRNKMEYRNTIAAVINSFIEDLPKNAEAAKSIIEQFNPEDFQQVINFAKAANGGRDI